MKHLSLLVPVLVSLVCSCGGSSAEAPEPATEPPPPAPAPADPAPEPVAQPTPPATPPAPTCAPRAVDPCAAGAPAPITITDARRRARRLRGQTVAIAGTLRQADQSCTEAECDNTCTASIVIGGAADTDPTVALTTDAPGAAPGTAPDGFLCQGDAGDPCDAPRPTTRPDLCCSMAVSGQQVVASGTLAQDGDVIRLQSATVCVSP